MISKTHQKIGGYEISADKAISLDPKTDFTGADEGENDSLDNFHVPSKRTLSFRHQFLTPLVVEPQVSFEIASSCPCDAQPVPKRRRFQRRNSKTAKMLSKAMLPVLELDLAGKERSTPSCPEYDEAICIAKDLVRHCKSNRKRAQSMRQS